MNLEPVNSMSRPISGRQLFPALACHTTAPQGRNDPGMKAVSG